MIKIFALKGNFTWIFANGDTRKLPRCNVKLCRKKDDVNNDNKVSERGGKEGVKFEEEIEENKLNKEEENGADRRMKTRSIDKDKKEDLKLDNVSTFWMKVENYECFDNITIYTVDIPKKTRILHKLRKLKEYVIKFI